MALLALIVFAVAYALVMLEEVIDLRKSTPMVLAAGLIWFLAGIAFTQSGRSAEVQAAAAEAITSYGALLLFLLVSITYVNVLDERGVFARLQSLLAGLGLSYRALFWLIGAVTFCLSIVLANMTVALVMGAVTLGLGKGNARFITLTCIMIVVASNAGGAFCPFGDVTSLMLWQAGALPFGAFFKLFLPALANWLLPSGIMAFAMPEGAPPRAVASHALKPYAITVVVLFAFTVFLSAFGNAMFGLPPVIGMVMGLGLLQALVFVMKHQAKRKGKGDLVLDSFTLMQQIEWDTLLFFLGVMFSVSGLSLFGWLALANLALYQRMGSTVANVLIGPLSALLDNVPLVYGVLNMRPEMDQHQWLLLALAAGVGGSLLSIGSSAGIALMGLAGRNYTFGQHLRWLPAIAIGYAAAVALHLTLN